MKKYIILIAAGFIFACSNSTETNENVSKYNAREMIVQLENDLLELPTSNKKEIRIVEKRKHELIDTLLTYYRNYSKDTIAPVYLDKIHILYSGLGEYRLSAKYADMILNDYPYYVNRKMIIESQIMNYELFIHPRNSEKIRYYIEMLLEEYPEMEESEQEEYRKRLENIDESVFKNTDKGA